jgi:K+-transporting ATPase ATPase A chain
MSAGGWLTLAALFVAIFASTIVLGRYMARVFGGGSAPGDRFFGPIERFIFRCCRIDPDREQRWQSYAFSMLAFSAVSILGLYLLQRIQGALPLNPQGLGGVAPDNAFNNAASFSTNTDWQAYAPESTMSYFTQMVGLTVQNFASAAVGMAVAIALIRGLARRRSATIGNFWADLVKGTLRVLLPLSFVFGIFFAASGVIDNFHDYQQVTTVEGQTQTIAQGPVASQESIKELGTNGGGFFNANSSHPYENPNGLTNFVQLWMVIAIPFALAYTFGKLVGDTRQGWVVFATMWILLGAGALLAMGMEARGNPNLTTAGATQQITADQPGGNLEGKEVRFGPEASGLYGAVVTGTSAGPVNSMHDSYTPLGGAAPWMLIMLSETVPGGVGSGLYGILVFALTSVFIAGLMVGRTPEYLGKKIQAADVKLVVIYILLAPVVILIFSAISIVSAFATNSLANSGPHGLTEMTYAYLSAGNNNGSAFAGISANTAWFNTTLGICILVGRYLLMVPVLAIAGGLARKQATPPSAGTFPTNTPLFAGLLVTVMVIVVGLTYFPIIALGPIAEHLSGTF